MTWLGARLPVALLLDAVIRKPNRVSDGDRGMHPKLGSARALVLDAVIRKPNRVSDGDRGV